MCVSVLMCKYACTKACSYCAKNKGDSRDLSSRTEENFLKLRFTPLLYVRLNSHYEVWSYKKTKDKKIKAYRKSA